MHANNCNKHNQLPKRIIPHVNCTLWIKCFVENLPSPCVNTSSKLENNYFYVNM